MANFNIEYYINYFIKYIILYNIFCRLEFRDMTLTSITGALGSGKTFMATYLASKLVRPILSNYQLHFSNYEPLELFDLIDLKPHSNVIIDEAYAWLDCRNFGRPINKYASYILWHSRKTFNDFILTLPVFSTIDIRFRDMSHKLIEAKAIGKQYYKGLRVPKRFSYKFKNREKGTCKYRSIDFYDALPYFKKFNTLEMIDPAEKQELEFHFIVKNGKLLKKKTMTIADVIKKDINKITHPTVKFGLLVNEIPLQYEPYVYNYLKGKSIIEVD